MLDQQIHEFEKGKDLCVKCNCYFPIDATKWHFGKEMEWIQCDNPQCQSWYHQVCTNMTINEYNQIQKSDKPWYCSPKCGTKNNESSTAISD